MSSSIKLKNANGKTVSVTNSNANQTDKEVIYLNTVDELANASGSINAVAIVSDLNRGGTFEWSATGTANGGTVFAGVSGYWNRQYSGAVNVKWFGAVGDGITDDTVPIQKAIDETYVVGGGILLIPSGKTFRITASLNNKSNVTICGFGETSVIFADGAFKAFNQDIGTWNNIGWNNFKIKGTATSYDALKESSHGINLLELTSNNSFIKNMWFENLWGDGVYVRSNNVNIEGVFCKNTYRQGIAVTKGSNISIKNVRGSGSMITLVDIEPNSGDQINYLNIDDVVYISDTIPALRFYHSVDVNDVVNNVKLSNITTKTLGIKSVTNLVANNLLIGSTNTTESLSLYLVDNAEISNVVISGANLTTQTKLKSSLCDNLSIVGINIEGGANIDVDILENTNTTISDLRLLNVGNIGIRVRNSAKTSFASSYISGANNYAVYLAPTTSLSKTSFRSLIIENSSTGVYASGSFGDIYMDGDLTGATTPIELGTYGGKFYYGSCLGVSPLVGSSTYAPGTIADGTGVTTTISVPGVVLNGGFVDVLFSRDLQGVTVTGWISSSNTVSVRFQNETGGNVTFASGTLTVYVRRTY